MSILAWMVAGVALLGAAETAGTAAPPLDIVGGEAAAASGPRELLGRLAGRWVLAGEIAGQATTHDVDGAWVLQGNYVRLTEISREKDAAGKAAYEAMVLLGWAGDHYVCFWFDNTEVATSDGGCRAKEAGDTIALEFHAPDGALSFTNTFAYDRKADAWTWKMANIKDGAATPFASVTLKRP